MVKLWLFRTKLTFGSDERLLQSIVYWPVNDLEAPMSLLLGKVSKFRPKEVIESAYMSSAMVVGRAMSEVPVSKITPVFSNSATLSPKPMALNSTSQ